MENIKKLLGSELFASVEEKLNGETITLVPKGKKVFFHKENETPIITNNGEWIPKSKFNELNESLKSERKTTANNIQELETLKKSVSGNIGLQETIEKMKAEAEKIKAESELMIGNLEKKNLVQESLEAAGAIRSNAKLLLNEIPLEKVELVDGKIKDVESLLSPVMETHKSLFGAPKLKGGDPKAPEGAPDGYITKDKFIAMLPHERAANIKKINESSPHWQK